LQFLLKQSHNLSREVQLHHLSQGGLFRTLQQLREGEIPLSFGSFEAIRDTCFITTERKGLFHEISSTAYIGSDTVRTRAILGYSVDRLFDNALSLTGTRPMLVISSGTYVEGSVGLNDGLVRYSPPYIEEQQPLNGQVVEDSSFGDFTLAAGALDSILGSYRSRLEEYDPSLFNVIEGGIYDAQELTAYSHVYVDGDLVLKSDSGYLEQTEIIICKHNLTVEGRITISKPIELIAGENVFIKDSSQVTNAVIFAKGGIYFQGFCNATGQFLSEKQIMVTGHASLRFPSYLVVPVNSEKVFGDPEVAILKNSSFAGSVLVYQRNESSDQDGSFNLPGRVKVESSASFTGGIYCEGNAEIYGKIDGFIHAENLEQMDGVTRWTNLLKNTQLYRHTLSPDYPLPPVFNSMQELSFLEIRRVDNLQ
ncbi:MAG: hypothetical protein ACE5EE_00005, partial [Fidelibacterota bacterium]